MPFFTLHAGKQTIGYTCFYYYINALSYACFCGKVRSKHRNHRVFHPVFSILEHSLKIYNLKDHEKYAYFTHFFYL